VCANHTIPFCQWTTWGFLSIHGLRSHWLADQPFSPGFLPISYRPFRGANFSLLRMIELVLGDPLAPLTKQSFPCDLIPLCFGSSPLRVLRPAVGVALRGGGSRYNPVFSVLVCRNVSDPGHLVVPRSFRVSSSFIVHPTSTRHRVDQRRCCH